MVVIIAVAAVHLMGRLNMAGRAGRRPLGAETRRRRRSDGLRGRGGGGWVQSVDLDLGRQSAEKKTRAAVPWATTYRRPQAMKRGWVRVRWGPTRGLRSAEHRAAAAWCRAEARYRRKRAWG